MISDRIDSRLSRVLSHLDGAKVALGDRVDQAGDQSAVVIVVGAMTMDITATAAASIQNGTTVPGQVLQAHNLQFLLVTGVWFVHVRRVAQLSHTHRRPDELKPP